MVVSGKSPACWSPGPSSLGLLSGTGLSGHQGRGGRRPPPTSPSQHPILGGPLHPARPGPRRPPTVPACRGHLCPADTLQTQDSLSLQITPGGRNMTLWGNRGQDSRSPRISPAALPCPGYRPVTACGWVSAALGSEGAGGLGVEQHPLPRFLLGQSPSRPC